MLEARNSSGIDDGPGGLGHGDVGDGDRVRGRDTRHVVVYPGLGTRRREHRAGYVNEREVGLEHREAVDRCGRRVADERAVRHSQQRRPRGKNVQFQFVGWQQLCPSGGRHGLLFSRATRQSAPQSVADGYPPVSSANTAGRNANALRQQVEQQGVAGAEGGPVPVCPDRFSTA